MNEWDLITEGLRTLRVELSEVAAEIEGARAETTAIAVAGARYRRDAYRAVAENPFFAEAPFVVPPMPTHAPTVVPPMPTYAPTVGVPPVPSYAPSVAPVAVVRARPVRGFRRVQVAV
ncbi:hypothetical protein AB0O47_39895 [Streptomyces noursei]|uniref:hypothetical protein n=1 Tax=Streptomyces noursei TaxID=1971 RepID=UPI00344D0B64